MEVALLGPLTIDRGGPPLEVTGPKRIALLTLLALELGRPVSRDRIVDALWPRRLTGREDSTLRVHVSHLRDLLEPSRDEDPRFLVTVGSSYMLAADTVTTDVARFDRLNGDGRAALTEGAPDTALALLNEALELWRGRPLQDVEYEEFAQPQIRRLEQARVEALENRAAAWIELGENSAAVDDLESLVRLDPIRERPVLLLMRALYGIGRQSDALRAARRHVRSLLETGLTASPRLTLLEEQILRHDPALQPRGVAAGEIKPGRSVRGYELREEAGAGAMGVVYRAYQASVGREVALKAIHPRLAQTPEFVRCFTEEARTVAGLEHPHIVPLHDFWRDPAGAFLAMRWMDGGSFGDRTGTRWDPEELGRVFGQLSDALGYAHSAGVVHRDVKPANVLFDGSGNAYLSDFGLAVTGVDTGAERRSGPLTLDPPYASPEVLRGEPPTVVSDVYALGAMLAEAASGRAHDGSPTALADGLGEIVRVATATDAGDRFPDMIAFRTALLDVIGPRPVSIPRRIRRNPYKGLAPFGESDRADFYGRDDMIETLIHAIGQNGLTAVIGASGSGKSSLVTAGVIPELRDSALPGSEEWAIVHMVPGTDPFDEFHIGLRSAAVGYSGTVTEDRTRELREAFAAALEGPRTRALLVIDQFEELFSSSVTEETRQVFLDNLVDLATDPAHRVRVLLTLRADFSDRPLAHPSFGDHLARGSVLVAPMRPEQIEDVIRRPATRVGVQVEPGLVAEIVRDVEAAPANLPLLQYVLTELFERRTEDRLTVQAYRSLGGVRGVLERKAEATFASLGPDAQTACRHLFLRMVHLGERGEETRRRLPLTEMHGLGRRVDVDEALEAFSNARLLTYDRDPVTRAPTVEVAHETVISRWPRYRVWVDDVRTDLVAHGRLATAATTWAAADEDPAYLLTGGPLAAALELQTGGRIELNELESRYLTESDAAYRAVREVEAARRREETALRQSARRRLRLGIATAAVALIVAVLGGLAWLERQRADALAATLEHQNLARELSALSRDSLTATDPDLSLLLAIAAAEESLAAGEEIPAEVIDALHLAIINPRPYLEMTGARHPDAGEAGEVIDLTRDGTRLVMLAEQGGAAVLDTESGDLVSRIPESESVAFGIEFHPDDERVYTTHADGLRLWAPTSRMDDQGVPVMELEAMVTPDTTGSPVFSAATHGMDPNRFALGLENGTIEIWEMAPRPRLVTRLDEHRSVVRSLDFDPTGARLVSGGGDQRVLVWDIARGEVVGEPHIRDNAILPIYQVAWHPMTDEIAVVAARGDAFLYGLESQDRRGLGRGLTRHQSISFFGGDGAGLMVIAAGQDGFARLYGTNYGGEAAVALQGGGAPVVDAEFLFAGQDLLIATVGADGTVRLWSDIYRSELPAWFSGLHHPRAIATTSGGHYIFGSYNFWDGAPEQLKPWLVVVDASDHAVVARYELFRNWDLRRRPAIADDASRVAFVGEDGDVVVATVGSDEVVSIPNSGSTTALAFNSDGSRLAGGFTDGRIAVWDTTTGEQVRIFEGHGAGEKSQDLAGDPAGRATTMASYTSTRVELVMFRPGSTQLASAGLDGELLIWDSNMDEPLRSLSFENSITAFSYSPDGSEIVVADEIGTVLVVDADSLEVHLEVGQVTGPIPQLAYSPDGSRIAGAGPGQFAYVWDRESGRIVRQIHGSILDTHSVAFVNDGTELLVNAGEGIRRGYVLDPVRLVEIAKERVGRDMTEEECLEYLRRPCEGEG